tara:strand:+ start:187 stop:1311 length:1125 start_codon:yes stop_codon:yes gene_type:complete
MKVIILFTYGISLSDWENSGLLDREVKLYNFLHDNYGVKFTFITFGDKSDLRFQEKIPNIKIVPLYEFINKSKSKSIELFRSLFFAFRLKKLIPISNSIIKTNQLWGAWIGILLKIITKNKLFIRTGYDLLTFKKNEGKSKIKIFFFKLLTNNALKFSNLYSVTSNTDLISLKSTFPKYQNKIILLPNWVEIENNDSSSSEDVKLISVGRLEYQKNYDYLIKSFANSNFELNIIGEGSLKETLIDTAKKTNSKVNFLGSINNKELIDTLKKYEYFISSTFYEGNPKAILEALSVGCIVVAPNVKGVNEIIKDGYNGFLYSLKDTNLNELILKLNNIDKSEIKENAKNYIKNNHELSLLANKEIQAYKELLNLLE